MQKELHALLLYHLFQFPLFREKKRTIANIFAIIIRGAARAEFNTVMVLTCTSALLFVTHTAEQQRLIEKCIRMNFFHDWTTMGIGVFGLRSV